MTEETEKGKVSLERRLQNLANQIQAKGEQHSAEAYQRHQEEQAFAARLARLSAPEFDYEDDKKIRKALDALHDARDAGQTISHRTPAAVELHNAIKEAVAANAERFYQDLMQDFGVEPKQSGRIK